MNGNRNFGIILEQLLVLAFVVEFIGLMLAESVQALFVVERLEGLLNCVTVSPFNRDGSEGTSVLILLKKLFAVFIKE